MFHCQLVYVQFYNTINYLSGQYQLQLQHNLFLLVRPKDRNAIDCQFVYGFVPNSTLEKTIYNQSKQLSLRRIARASHTMALEGQALTKEENTDILSEMIEDLINELPSSLWDNK